MRRSTVVTALGLGLVLAWGARPAHALADNERLEAHVPFAFHVYDTLLPAGDYVIKEAQMVSPGVLEIRKDDGTAAAFVLVDPAGPRPSLREAELVFDRYGRQRYLHAILQPDETGARLLTSPAEVRAARAMSRAALKTEHTEATQPGTR